MWHIAQEALDVDTFFKKLDGSAENEDVEVGIEEEVMYIIVLISVFKFFIPLSYLLIIYKAILHDLSNLLRPLSLSVSVSLSHTL